MTDDAPRSPRKLDNFELRTAEDLFRRLPSKLSPLEEAFFKWRHRRTTKWLHYLGFYEQVLSRHRHAPVRLLEIGVRDGGSLDVWRTYFGPKAVLMGIDIDPECAGKVDAPNQVRIGSQDDPAFLSRVVDEMGGVDVVLDDGSHCGRHQIASFRALWPRLSYGGVYLIEDLHAAYWPEFEGGYQRGGTGIDLVKDLIDDLHGWYSERDPQYAPREEIGSIMIADSIVAIHKVRREKPGFFSIAIT